jgi:hypothetical protein
MNRDDCIRLCSRYTGTIRDSYGTYTGFIRLYPEDSGAVLEGYPCSDIHFHFEKTG